MERVIELRGHAAELRSIAVRSGEHPNRVGRMLALAAECERVADALAATLSATPEFDGASKPE